VYTKSFFSVSSFKITNQKKKSKKNYIKRKKNEKKMKKKMKKNILNTMSQISHLRRLRRIGSMLRWLGLGVLVYCAFVAWGSLAEDEDLTSKLLLIGGGLFTLLAVMFAALYYYQNHLLYFPDIPHGSRWTFVEPDSYRRKKAFEEVCDFVCFVWVSGRGLW
jgi:hypothetical protein